MSTSSRTAGSPWSWLVHLLHGGFGRIIQRCFISVDTQILGTVPADPRLSNAIDFQANQKVCMGCCSHAKVRVSGKLWCLFKVSQGFPRENNWAKQFHFWSLCLGTVLIVKKRCFFKSISKRQNWQRKHCKHCALSHILWSSDNLVALSALSLPIACQVIVFFLLF